MSARSVLVIHENAEWYVRVTRFLESHGIEVVAATTIDAVAALTHFGEPSAVLMDMTSVEKQTSGTVITARNDSA